MKQYETKTRQELFEMIEDLLKMNKILDDAISEALESIKYLQKRLPLFKLEENKTEKEQVPF